MEPLLPSVLRWCTTMSLSRLVHKLLSLPLALHLSLLHCFLVHIIYTGPLRLFLLHILSVHSYSHSSYHSVVVVVVTYTYSILESARLSD
jgi:hypothetical protein